MSTTELSPHISEAADDQDQAPARGGAPSRTYVVLEEIELEDAPGRAWAEATRVEARNGPNAKRKAFKDLREQRGEDFDDATLVVIPEGQWKPERVRAVRNESITVAVGGN